VKNVNNMEKSEMNTKFTLGDKVILDKVKEVIVISQTPKRLMTKVREIETFTVMTYRLSKKS